MREQLILIETARLAKEKGFGWETFRYYEDDGHLSNFWGNNNYNRIPDAFSAPTQSLLQKWLREVHKININCMWQNGHFELLFSKQAGPANHFAISEESQAAERVRHQTYEECLEYGLQVALRAIK